MSLDLKANLESPTFTGTVSGITKAMVGLSNVNNTSDMNKPISNSQQTVFNLKQDCINSNSSLIIGKISSTEIVNNGNFTVKGNCYIGDQTTDTVTFYNNMTINGITKSTVGLGNVDNVSDALKPISAEQQAALNLKAPLASPQFSGIPIAPTATPDINTTQIATTAFVHSAVSNLIDNAPQALDTLKELSSALGADANFATTVATTIATKAPLASPAFTGTVTGISKVMVGLENVDNTTDALKPVSAAQLAALDLKAPLASPAFTGTVTGISKAMVGLENVDNTTDALKPVSAAQLAALDLKLNLSGGTITGNLVSQQTTNIMEVISTATIASNAVTCNYASGGLYYLTGLTSSTNFALTLTNCNPANSLNVSNVITLLINCDSFQAYANSINVNGSAKTMIYSGGATAISLTGATMVCQTISVVYSGNASVPIYVISNVAPYFA